MHLPVTNCLDVANFNFILTRNWKSIVSFVTWLFGYISASFSTTGFDRFDRISRASISFVEKKMVMIVIQPAFFLCLLLLPYWSNL